MIRRLILTLAVALTASPGSAADALQHTGIWCTGKAEDGSCVSIYELLDDNTFAAYNLYAESQTRYDVFGRWDERPGKACFLLQAWLLIDLAEDVTVRSGDVEANNFYCNDIVEANEETLVVTAPAGDQIITATRLDELPKWAR
ncbi:MAG: hypothetical protein AAF545_11945 [Pseudomonadota bacterium]